MSDATGEPILELRRVRFGQPGGGDLRLHHVNFTLRRGELAWVHTDPSANVRGVASLIQGLESPESGEVIYQGEEWSRRRFIVQDRMRFRIGRIFAAGAWVESLTVRENLRLAPTHHGISEQRVDQRVDEIINDLASVREDGGGASLQQRMRDHLRKRPAYVPVALRQLFQWLRVALFERDVWLLEKPDSNMTDSMKQLAVDWLHRSLGSGAAVLWFGGGTPESLQTPGQKIQVRRGVWADSNNPRSPEAVS